MRTRAEQRPLFMDYLYRISGGKIFAGDGGMLVRGAGLLTDDDAVGSEIT